jgi:AcrR family transcriptional regulator
VTVRQHNAKVGRPRSEQARDAVLHAADDLLEEVGYAALTVKGIAERAGVGRQTVYRWWSTKAEILFEACVTDAEEELSVPRTPEPAADLASYLTALVTFLARSPAGAAYRALLAAAQHDRAVKDLIATRDVLADSARTVLARNGLRTSDEAAARVIGTPFFWVMSGRDPDGLHPGELARDLMRDLTPPN